MKPLQIDFAPRHGWLEAGTDKARRPLWALLCGLMLLLLAASLTTAWKLQRERSAVNTRIATLQSALNISEEGEAQNETATAESAQAIALANMHLNFPWVGLLGTLERNTRPEIRLVSLEMGVLRQSSKLVVETTDTPSALSFVDTLRAQPAYASLTLTRQETVAADGASRMRFTLEAPLVQAEQPARKAGAR
ncbi:MAG: hypothetical protein JWL63_2418 [Rhodocyclales bacterium]|nr:hypothetical protein [Rhodocyclales bacterium]